MKTFLCLSAAGGLGWGGGLASFYKGVACKANVFCSANDLDVELTEIWGEPKKDSKGEVDGSK